MFACLCSLRSVCFLAGPLSQLCGTLRLLFCAVHAYHFLFADLVSLPWPVTSSVCLPLQASAGQHPCWTVVAARRYVALAHLGRARLPLSRHRFGSLPWPVTICACLPLKASVGLLPRGTLVAAVRYVALAHLGGARLPLSRHRFGKPSLAGYHVCLLASASFGWSASLLDRCCSWAVRCTCSCWAVHAYHFWAYRGKCGISGGFAFGRTFCTWAFALQPVPRDIVLGAFGMSKACLTR